MIDFWKRNISEKKTYGSLDGVNTHGNRNALYYSHLLYSQF